jgi:hypothetical protein
MSTKKIGEFSEGHLLKRAAEIVAEKTHGSKVLDTAAEARIPKFDNSGTCFGGNMQMHRWVSSVGDHMVVDLARRA